MGTPPGAYITFLCLLIILLGVIILTCAVVIRYLVTTRRKRGKQDYDAFLCHNNSEKSLVEDMALHLQNRAGVKSWLDTWHISGGVLWEKETDKALGSCKSCVVILGEHGWGKFHLREAQLALEIRKRQPSYRVIPVIFPNAPEQDLKLLRQLFEEIQWVDLSNGWYNANLLNKLIAAILWK